MIQLDKSQYHHAIKLLQEASINTLFARSVVEQQELGMVYADHSTAPTSFLIVHPYGMSLLLGATHHEDFNATFRNYAFNVDRKRFQTEWLQASPGDWDPLISRWFQDKMVPFSEVTQADQPGIIELHTRVNFAFNKDKYLKSRCDNINQIFPIVRITAELFDQMEGTVVPKHFWNGADHFLQRGIGFSWVEGNEVACTAYSAFVVDRKLEIGIETVAEYRGKGLALHACRALIDYCLDHDLEPVWACRKENSASYRLAQKLGFEPTLSIPYYKLMI